MSFIALQNGASQSRYQTYGSVAVARFVRGFDTRSRTLCAFCDYYLRPGEAYALIHACFLEFPSLWAYAHAHCLTNQLAEVRKEV